MWATRQWIIPVRVLTCALVAGTLASCGGQQKKQQDFFTSGSRAADQRADQRMAQHQQLRGEKNAGNKTPAKLSLYQRLGGEQGLTTLVNDWVDRAMADPRVNWDRNGVEAGGFLHIGQHSVAWNATPENVAAVKTHIVQFLAVATGGPTKYTGKSMKEAHQGMQITNAAFDAAVGDMKASLDKYQVSTDDQKELLAIMESTRPQIVTVR